ncbi:DNA directed RNA polymerase subunit P/RPABC4 [Natrinema hispanicum]|uniref:DNA-directed RNA polymerase subunit Rpo12 n=1 Tax=Natrinema hispanicum TaxID=392421 RepID=A0A482YDK9_9EURY|nr:DNA directed RNA polymerase subunit P/RPABC4 [Natrinema hispanicum]
MGWTDSQYPSNWNSIRKEVLERDGYQCKSCGETEKELHVHHVEPLSEGGSNSKNNLKTLCHPCHEDVHGHPIPTAGSTQDRPCPNNPNVTYKCSKCKRKVTLFKYGGIRCPMCGNRILLKERAEDVKEVDVK